MKGYKKILIICLFSVLSVFFACASPPAAPSACALSTVSFLSAECLDYDGETASYDVDNPVYARGISLTFETNAEYCMVLTLKNGAEISRTGVLGGGIVRHAVEQNGELTVRCFVAAADGVLSTVYAEAQVRSDNAPPEEPFVSSMTDWTRHENGFLVQVVLGADNGNSGVKKADIAVTDEDGTDVRTVETPLTNDSFTVYKPSTVYITVIDYAGNFVIKECRFDKFDSEPPTAPTFIFTPDTEPSEATNGYVREYSVSIQYGDDADGSGIKAGSMLYTLNGQQYAYGGSFLLNEQRSYAMTAYYSDNAGNTSPIASAFADKIDRTAPSINDINLDIDLRRALPYTLSLTCTDSNSGVDSVRINGKNYVFTRGMHNVYTAVFETLDISSIEIIASDRLANHNSAVLLVPHFDDLDYEDMAAEYHMKYLALREDDYNAAAWQRLDGLYGDLNLCFKTRSSTAIDFDTLTAEIDAAIDGAVAKKYIIESVPSGINLGADYSYNAADFPLLKKGDEMTLILKKIDAEGDELDNLLFNAVSLSGFKTAFANPFVLEFRYNGAEVADALAHGFTLTFPVPAGYEERRFAIIDLDFLQKVEAEVINNTVTFTSRRGGSFALVTEGEKRLAPEDAPARGVRVFGKNISWGAFLGTIGGVAALTAGLAAFITYKYKEPAGRRKPRKDKAADKD